MCVLSANIQGTSFVSKRNKLDGTTLGQHWDLASHNVMLQMLASRIHRQHARAHLPDELGLAADPVSPKASQAGESARKTAPGPTRIPQKAPERSALMKSLSPAADWLLGVASYRFKQTH